MGEDHSMELSGSGLILGDTPLVCDAERTGLVTQLEAFGLNPRPIFVTSLNEFEPNDGWIDQLGLSSPSDGRFGALMMRLQERGYSKSKRGAAASLLLRYGWASGLTVASYLVGKRLIAFDGFALKFSKTTMLEAIAVSNMRIVSRVDAVSAENAQQWVAHQLREMTESCVEALHKWSGYSRPALWAMVTSSWAAQITGICEVLCDVNRGVEEAKAIIHYASVPKNAHPELYLVSANQKTRVCQKRAQCCLYYKTVKDGYCASCPLLEEQDRLARNKHWVSLEIS